MIVYYIMRGDVAAQKKGWLNMLMHCFFVIDENGNEIHGEKYGFVNDFYSFSKASAAARHVSKLEKGRFSVSVCVPGTMYENGKVLKEF